MQGAGERVFYESLFGEKPSSEMALVWCVEHGVFQGDLMIEKAFKSYMAIKNKAKK